MNEPASTVKVSRLLGQYIVKYSFQFKLSFIIVGFVGITSLVLWLEGYMGIGRILSSGMVVNEDTTTQLKIIINVVGKTAILLSGITFGLALVLSHYIAGPIYRFEKIFQALQEGNLGLIVRLRRKDAFQETADQLNRAISSLRTKLQKERGQVHEALTSFAKKLEGAGRVSEAVELKKLLEEIQANPLFIKTNLPR